MVQRTVDMINAPRALDVEYGVMP